MSIDLATVFRRIKPDKRLKTMAVRPPRLTAARFNTAGPVVLDTNIYIHNASGRLTPDAGRLIDQGRVFHCSVCVGELMTGIGAFDPSSAKWKAVRDHYGRIIDTIPPTRMLVPDEDIWIEAGLIAGVLSRTQGFQPHQRKECLNDALIHLTAAKAGMPVLTHNASDFDLIQQVCGRGTYIAV